MREPMWWHLYPPSGSFGTAPRTENLQILFYVIFFLNALCFPSWPQTGNPLGYCQGLRLEVWRAMSWPAQCHPSMPHNAHSQCKNSQTEPYHADWHIFIDNCIQTLKEKAAWDNAETRTENPIEAEANTNPNRNSCCFFTRSSPG